jgi:hypothetical protein
VLKVKQVRESTGVVTKDDIIKAIRLYGLDSEKIKKIFMRHEPGQHFAIETDKGNIMVHVEFDIRDITIEVPASVQEQLTK